MTSTALTKLRAKLIAQTKATGFKPSSLTVKRKRASMQRALCAHGAAQVWDRIQDCGTARTRCGSLHCVRCFNRYVDHQTRRVQAMFDYYATEADQRANIRHLTVLFDAFGFDLHSKPYPTLPNQRVKAARDHARKELYALKRRFPSIRIVGAFEMEPIDGPTKTQRKDASAIDALLIKGQRRNVGSPFYNVVTVPGMQHWANHVILYHGHFVVDLNGTPDKDFREWCHARWGHKCPNISVRRGAFVQRLYANRTIEESIKILSRYPLKTPFHYRTTKTTRGVDAALRTPYEDAILASIIATFMMNGITAATVMIGCR